jgi:hypothetical protein
VASAFSDGGAAVILHSYYVLRLAITCIQDPSRPARRLLYYQPHAVSASHCAGFKGTFTCVCVCMCVCVSMFIHTCTQQDPSRPARRLLHYQPYAVSAGHFAGFQGTFTYVCVYRCMCVYRCSYIHAQNHTLCLLVIVLSSRVRLHCVCIDVHTCIHTYVHTTTRCVC